MVPLPVIVVIKGPTRPVGTSENADALTAVMLWLKVTVQETVEVIVAVLQLATQTIEETLGAAHAGLEGVQTPFTVALLPKLNVVADRFPYTVKLFPAEMVPVPVTLMTLFAEPNESLLPKFSVFEPMLIVNVDAVVTTHVLLPIVTLAPHVIVLPEIVQLLKGVPLRLA